MSGSTVGFVNEADLDKRVMELHSEISVPHRHALTIAVAESLFPSFRDLRVLDIACGHNFPFFSWFQDFNDGPLLAGYFTSQGARVTGLDELHFRRHKQFRDYEFAMVWGNAFHLEKYLFGQEFDLITSTAFFGYPSSRNGTRPDASREMSILEQAKRITAPGGYGIHLLIDGYWQLREEDLKDLGYRVIKYLNPSSKDTAPQKSPRLYDNVVIVQKA